jgi:hypothetical protein
MESKELRLGNLFIEENSNKIIEVIGLEKNRVVFSGMFVDKWQAKPIPLIEEWLEKLGFTKELDGLYRKNKSELIEILFYANGWQVTTQSVCLNHIKYVHQLQNLYFALTGAELTVA